MGDRTARRRRHVPDAPEDAERVSLYGPPFEDVLKAFLAVDPKELDGKEADADGNGS